MDETLLNIGLSPSSSAQEVSDWIVANQSLGREDPGMQAAAQLYRELKAKQIGTPQLPTEKLGFFGSIGESITGSRRMTPEVESLPRAGKMPELNTLSLAGMLPQLKTAAGTAMANQQEMANIIKGNFPDIKVRYDMAGNPILRSGVDGQEYIIAPGFDLGDIPRVGAATAMLYGAGGKTLPGQMVRGGAFQAAYEAFQKATGGEFDLEPIGGAIFAPPVMKAIMGVPRLMIDMGQSVYSNIAERILQRGTSARTTSRSPFLTNDELVSTAKDAINGNPLALRILAESSAPDPEIVAAAERLGIADNLQSDHVTSNIAYRKLLNILKSKPSSKLKVEEINGMTTIGNRVVQLIDELGGTTDLSAVNAEVKSAINTSINSLQTIENNQWNTLRDNIGLRTEVSPTNTLNYLNSLAMDLGGTEFLSASERRWLDTLSPQDIEGTLAGQKIIVGQRNPTYAYLDRIRRQVGQALSKKTGPFADEEEGALKQMYAQLSKDVEDVAENAGQKDLFDSARATTQLLKSAEDDLVSIYGRDLSNSLAQSLSTAAKNLSGKGTYDNFNALIESIPEELRERAVISAFTSAFSRAGQTGNVSFSSYRTWYEGLLRNKTAKDSVFNTLNPRARQFFSDLYLVSRGLSDAVAAQERTGRLMVEQGLNTAETTLDKIWEVSKRAAAGLAIDTALSTVGAPSGAAISGMIAARLAAGRGASSIDSFAAAEELLSSPAFRDLLRESASPEGVSQQTLKRMERDARFKRWAKAVNLPVDGIGEFLMNLTRGAAPDVTTEAPIQEAPPAPPPQARVQPPTIQTRGVPGLGQGAAPTAPPQVAGGPRPTAQGPAAPSSRQMLQDLFPFDTTLRAG